MSGYLQYLLGQKKNKEQETRGKNEKSVGNHWSFEKWHNVFSVIHTYLCY